MNSTDKLQLREQIRRWKSGMVVASVFVQEQALRMTPAERLNNQQRFLEAHASYAMALGQTTERQHMIPYHKLQEVLIARIAQRSCCG
jgi:hypothetical protein